MSESDRNQRIRAFGESVKRHADVEAALRGAFPELAKRLLDDVLDEEELAKAVSGAGCQPYVDDERPQR